MPQVNNEFVEMLKGQLILKDALFSASELFHICCRAHIFKLIVQDDLKEKFEKVSICPRPRGQQK